MAADDEIPVTDVPNNYSCRTPMVIIERGTRSGLRSSGRLGGQRRSSARSGSRACISKRVCLPPQLMKGMPGDGGLRQGTWRDCAVPFSRGLGGRAHSPWFLAKCVGNLDLVTRDDECSTWNTERVQKTLDWAQTRLQDLHVVTDK